MLNTCKLAFTAKDTHEATPTAKVAILLATYNGESFLSEQLASIAVQQHHNWQLWVSDDGSTDATLSQLQDYQRTNKQFISINHGPRHGFAENFMSMAASVESEAEYFAFCDQDDIWHSNHLSRAVAWLETLNPDIPALYCSRTALIDAGGQPLGFSPIFAKPPRFKNALVQSLAGGNTMIFNRRTKELLAQTSHLPIISHDWWAYMLVSGADGHILYNTEPSIDYRQHGCNLIGANTSWRSRLSRIKRVLKGQLHEWNDTNLESLTQCRHLLSPANQEVLQRFIECRQGSLITRLKGVATSGIYRQSNAGNIALWLATVLGKV